MSFVRRFIDSYKALSKRERIFVGLFGMATSMGGLWFTEKFLDVGQRERQPFGLVRRPSDADGKRPFIRMTKKIGEADNADVPK